MRMVFIGAEPEDFGRAKHRLLDEFEAWAETRGRVVDRDAAGAVLECRYLADGMLGRWTGALLHDVLASESGEVDAIGALFDFFADTDLFDVRSDSIESLRAALTDFRKPECPSRMPLFSTSLFDLAEENELREQAQDTVMVRRMRAFATWLAEEKDIDEFHEGHRLCTLAEGIGMLCEEELLADALALWNRMFDRMDIWMGARFADHDGKMLLDMLVSILSGSGSLAEDDLIRLLPNAGDEPLDRTQFDRVRTLAFDYGLAVRELRTLRRPRPETQDVYEATCPVYRLLPLGVRAVHRMYSESGVGTMTFDDITRETPEVMIAKVLTSDPALAAPILDSWIALRPPRDACAELGELIGRTDDFEHRMFALDLLGKLGPAGIEAIIALRDNPICGPCVATWLTRHGMLPPEDISDRELAYVRLDVLTSGLRQTPGRTMAQFAAQPRHIQVLLVEDMPGSGHPCTGEVLTKIATDHPDDFVAKAACQALGRLRAE